MNSATKADTVWFTTKGQVVIPLRLRKEFEIGDGTRATVAATAEGILIRPITPATIRRARGVLKAKPGRRPLAEEWAGHKEAERKLEEAKHGASSA